MRQGGSVVKAAINGGWDKTHHPAMPITPAELAAASQSAADAGAAFVHLHARDARGEQSIHPSDIDKVLTSVRAATDVPIGTTTGLWCCGDDPVERYRQVAAWRLLPDFASVAFCEAGAAEVAELLVAKGITLESAVWTMDDVPALLASPTLAVNTRILIEPTEQDPDQAVASARAIAHRIRAAGVTCPMLYHGHAATVWPVLNAAVADGEQVRIGLEDGIHLPDGSIAADNAELVRAAAAAAAQQPEGGIGAAARTL